MWEGALPGLRCFILPSMIGRCDRDPDHTAWSNRSTASKVPRELIRKPAVPSQHRTVPPGLPNAWAGSSAVGGAMAGRRYRYRTRPALVLPNSGKSSVLFLDDALQYVHRAHTVGPTGVERQVQQSLLQLVRSDSILAGEAEVEFQLVHLA